MPDFISTQEHFISLS